jgi:hypothetical protein
VRLNFWIANISRWCGLTPELTGAGGPTGPQGTNIGHENGEAMANVGVRVERFVRHYDFGGRDLNEFQVNTPLNINNNTLPHIIVFNMRVK